MITAVIVISFLSFIGLGLPDGLLGVAWPSLRGEFGQPIGAIALLLAAVSLGYLLSSVASGKVVRRAGLARALVVGAFAMAAGLVLIAVAPWWLLLMPGFALIGVGAGLIDAGFNAYAAHNFSATAMNWMHACYGIGATVGPPAMTFTLLRFGSWRPAYAASALFLAAVALMLVRTRARFGRQAAPARVEPRAADVRTRPAAWVPRPFLVWGGVLVFFLYSGIEVSAAQLSYTLLTEGRGVATVSAGFWVGAFWFSLTGGRILLGPLSQRVGGRVVLRGAFGLALVAALLFSLGLHSTVDGLSLSLLGICLAPVFPLLVLQTPWRVGPARAHDVIGYQMGAATLGSVALAGGGGVLAGRVGLAVIGPYILILVLLCSGLYALLTALRDTVEDQH